MNLHCNFSKILFYINTEFSNIFFHSRTHIIHNLLVPGGLCQFTDTEFAELDCDTDVYVIQRCLTYGGIDIKLNVLREHCFKSLVLQYSICF